MGSHDADEVNATSAEQAAAALGWQSERAQGQQAAEQTRQALEEALAQLQQVIKKEESTRRELEALREQVDVRRSTVGHQEPSSDHPATAASHATPSLLEVLDTDPALHPGAREAIRVLYERFTKRTAKG